MAGAAGGIPLWVRAIPTLTARFSIARASTWGIAILMRSATRPAWPFGHGLSYTAFAYGRPKLAMPLPCGGSARPAAFRVEVDVENAGPVAGAEVVQLYVCPPCECAFHEPRRLAAFAKVRLAPGERSRVTLEFGEMELRYWDAARHAWRVDQGDYELLVGSSSRDIRGSCSLHLAADTAPFPVSADRSALLADRSALAAYWRPDATSVRCRVDGDVFQFGWSFHLPAGGPPPFPRPRTPHRAVHHRLVRVGDGLHALWSTNWFAWWSMSWMSP